MAHTLVVIPARMQSTRLPGKPLADINGEPMIAHVWRRAIEADVGRVLVASDSEEILDDSVYRPESLGLSHGFESSHLSLALSDRLMRDFNPIVSVAFGVVRNRRHDRAVRCLITPQLVGDQSPRFAFLTLQ